MSLAWCGGCWAMPSRGAIAQGMHCGTGPVDTEVGIQGCLVFLYSDIASRCHYQLWRRRGSAGMRIVWGHFSLKCFPCGSAGKESVCNAGDLGLIPGLRRSLGEGKGYPLQYSGLENSMDYIVHGIAKSQTRLSDFHFH